MVSVPVPPPLLEARLPAPIVTVPSSISTVPFVKSTVDVVLLLDPAGRVSEPVSGAPMFATFKFARVVASPDVPRTTNLELLALKLSAPPTLFSSPKEITPTFKVFVPPSFKLLVPEPAFATNPPTTILPAVIDLEPASVRFPVVLLPAEVPPTSTVPTAIVVTFALKVLNPDRSRTARLLPDKPVPPTTIYPVGEF